MFYMCSVLETHSLSLCPHLQVNISDPFDDPMRGPHQWIHVLVLTLYPTSLQCLKTILTNTFYSTGSIFTMLREHTQVQYIHCCPLLVNMVWIRTYLLVKIE